MSLPASFDSTLCASYSCSSHAIDVFRDRKQERIFRGSALSLPLCVHARGVPACCLRCCASLLPSSLLVRACHSGVPSADRSRLFSVRACCRVPASGPSPHTMSSPVASSSSHEYAPGSLWWCESAALAAGGAATADTAAASAGWILVRALRQQATTPTLAQPWTCTVLVERGQSQHNARHAGLGLGDRHATGTACVSPSLSSIGCRMANSSPLVSAE